MLIHWSIPWKGMKCWPYWFELTMTVNILWVGRIFLVNSFFFFEAGSLCSTGWPQPRDRPIIGLQVLGL
jgi:hypothetical protein